MSLEQHFNEMFSYLPAEERLKAAFDAIEEGIIAGNIVAVWQDGDIAYTSVNV